jgi:hypothetical protein
MPNKNRETFLDKIEKIFVSSDWGEAEALYRGLPLYPYPEGVSLNAQPKE